VINSNLARILHRFRDIAFDSPKSLYLATPLVFNSPDGGVKMFTERSWVVKVPKGVETLPKILIA